MPELRVIRAFALCISLPPSIWCTVGKTYFRKSSFYAFIMFYKPWLPKAEINGNFTYLNSRGMGNNHQVGLETNNKLE